MGRGRFLFTITGLLAMQDGAGSAVGGHVEIQVLFVLAYHEPHAAEGGRGVLVAGVYT